MKKLVILIIVIGVISVISACTKEEQSNSAGINSSSLKQSSWGICCTFYVGPGACSSPKTNCFDEVVISRIEDYNELVDAANGGKQEVADYFNSESWKNIFPDLDADEGENSANIDYLRKLQSGDYDLVIYVHGDTPDKVNFLAGDDDEVTENNAEFDLQVDISEL